LAELAFDIPKPQEWRTRAGNDDDVRRMAERRVVTAKELAHQSAYAIARRCVANLAAGGDPDARRPFSSPPHQDDEMRRYAPAGFALHQKEIGPLPESMAARQALRD
jgi:hypothetical protein